MYICIHNLSISYQCNQRKKSIQMNEKGLNVSETNKKSSKKITKNLQNEF